jgi:hypothetical protein
VRADQAGVVLACAEQAEELDNVRRPHGVGVREDEHGGCSDRAPGGRPVVVLPLPLADLAERRGPVDVRIELVERGLLHDLASRRPHTVELGPDLRTPAFSLVRGGDDHQPADEIGMPGRDLRRDAATEGQAHHVRSSDAEVRIRPATSSAIAS